MKTRFSETLKELRIKAGYSQKDVYEKLGIPQSTFSSWETGKAEPSASMTLKLCDIYQVDDIMKAFGYEGASEEPACVLISQCHAAAYEVVEMFLRLDDLDHGKVIGRIETLLENEKYRKKDGESGARAG